jgi:sulfide:quinone oxidoreductase
VIAGGGVAGLEALIGLRTLAGTRAELELISPERTFAFKPLMVRAAFASHTGGSVEIADVVRSVDAKCTTDRLLAVDPGAHSLTLAGGARTEYDILVLAPGARSEEAIAGAVVFGAPGGTRRFRQILAEAEAGRIDRIVFAVPDGGPWPLALYELALLTAERLRAWRREVEITVVSPEAAPLAVFGGRASGSVLEALEDGGVHFVGGLHPDELAWGELRAHPGAARLKADAVITLPRLRGPAIAGIPADDRGFIPVDAHGLVRGLADVYAAGDAVAFGVKHGSLAAQQADATAEAIAARLGAAVTARPFHPVLRGMLLTGAGTHYLEAELGGGERAVRNLAGGEGSNGAHAGASTSTHPLWWPPSKIAGHYIAPYLCGQISGPPLPTDGLLVELDRSAEIGTVGRVGEEH